jgi:hypothetical protein
VLTRGTSTIAALGVILATVTGCQLILGLDDPTVADDRDGGGVDGPEPKPDALPVERVSGTVTGTVTWRATSTHVLDGVVYVAAGATLIIEAGTTIRGTPRSALIAVRGGRIVADGTPARPIVFTSDQATPAAGDWYGVGLLGAAPVNGMGGSAERTIFLFPDDTGRHDYGGADAGHDCGSLRYVRIEHAAQLYPPEAQPEPDPSGWEGFPALLAAGCGTATTIDHVQVHRAGDDGIAVSGGTVTLSHLVVTQPQDDGFDWGDAWTGTVQFLIVQLGPDTVSAAFEAGFAAGTSGPQLWNATLIGAGGRRQSGVILLAGTKGTLRNVILTDLGDFAIDLRGTDAIGRFGTSLRLGSFILDPAEGRELWPAGFDTLGGVENDCNADAMCFDEATALRAGELGMVEMDPGLTPSSLDQPRFIPGVALPPGETPPAGLDTAATYRGAVGSVDWTAGWTAYP